MLALLLIVASRCTSSSVTSPHISRPTKPAQPKADTKGIGKRSSGHFSCTNVGVLHSESLRIHIVCMAYFLWLHAMHNVWICTAVGTIPTPSPTPFLSLGLATNLSWYPVACPPVSHSIGRRWLDGHSKPSRCLSL